MDASIQLSMNIYWRATPGRGRVLAGLVECVLRSWAMTPRVALLLAAWAWLPSPRCWAAPTRRAWAQLFYRWGSADGLERVHLAGAARVSAVLGGCLAGLLERADLV